MGRLHGFVTWLVPVPVEDISNVIAGFDMPDDTFNREFGLFGSVIT